MHTPAHTCTCVHVPAHPCAHTHVSACDILKCLTLRGEPWLTWQHFHPNPVVQTLCKGVSDSWLHLGTNRQRKRSRASGSPPELPRHRLCYWISVSASLARVPRLRPSALFQGHVAKRIRTSEPPPRPHELTLLMATEWSSSTLVVLFALKSVLYDINTVKATFWVRIGPGHPLPSFPIFLRSYVFCGSPKDSSRFIHY